MYQRAETNDNGLRRGRCRGPSGPFKPENASLFHKSLLALGLDGGQSHDDEQQQRSPGPMQGIGAGMDEQPVKALLGIGCKGVVLAGMGQGNAPASVIAALSDAAASGVPVVRSTRVDEGLVDRNVEVDDDALGLVAARALGPAKARVLLMVLIANGITDPARIQSAFDAG